MVPLPHHYAVSLQGGPAGYARLSAPGLPDLAAAAPLDFDGPGDAWSPEHLLLAAVQACFLFTLRPVARLSGVRFRVVDAEVSGTVDRAGGAIRFTEIVLRPRVTVEAGANVDQVRRVLERTEKSCLVSASLAVPVRLEAEVVVAGAEATA